MATGDRENATLGILLSVALDVVVVSLLSWLIVAHVVPVYSAALVALPTLLAANFLIIRRASRRHMDPPASGIRISKPAWFGVAAFTVGAVVQIAYWIKEPDMRSTVQAIVGILLAGYVWFLVYRVDRFNRDRRRRG
jgi:O-antigen/teichoic acid export membrane protein